MITDFAGLRRRGLSRTQIDRAVRSGRLIRVRIGVYATPDTDDEVVAAVRCGGSVACTSALRRAGVWAPDRARHVRIDPHARVHGTADAVVHRRPGADHDGVDDLRTAILVAMFCVDAEQRVAILDSVLHLGVLSRDDLGDLLVACAGGRRALRRTRRSESGIESIARIRLVALGLGVRTQVVIPHIGRVDLIVGDRLVIECDGDEWHSDPQTRERDRRRDAALVAAGYLVLRVGYHRIMSDWAGFADEVLRVVRRREHLWRPVHEVG